MRKRIAILGSTGSIGRQALEVVREFPERFEVTALAAGSNTQLLVNQVREFRPKFIVVGHSDLYREVKQALDGLDVEITAGINGLTEAASHPQVDIVLTAVVGSLGIKPTLAAINANKRIALANKETLVAAGSMIMPAARRQNVSIYPVDSEHSAIFQCLEGRPPDQIERLILTASGGPFRGCQPEDLEHVTLEQALAHPNWKMGGKITIDSATMFNKGLEVIEAHWLFNMDFNRINVVIHPESIIHSMVELVDGSTIAQLGLCDMRLPIQYALSYPERLPNRFPRLDLTQGATLSFHPVDPMLFPAVNLAYQAGRTGGSLPAALNAANETAVQAFLDGQIKFTMITRIVSEVIGNHAKEGFAENPDLEEIFAVDRWARETAARLIRSLVINSAN